jgi:hypothetical protein
MAASKLHQSHAGSSGKPEAREASASPRTRRKESGSDTTAQIKHAFELALARTPSPRETDEISSFLAAGGELALAEFCQTLFNSNEFAFIP